MNNSIANFESAVSDQQPNISLCLFVAGLSPRSQVTIENLQKFCDQHLGGNYHLEIVDIYQQPDLARKLQIVATPTLVKYQPHPKKVMIGDLSRTDRVLSCFGVTI